MGWILKTYYLYRITNLVNEKLYFGITYQPSVRKYQHFKGKGPSISLVHKAVNKYGKENFKFELLCCGSKDYILELEAKAIGFFNTQQPNGYNIRSGGENSVWPEGHLSKKSKSVFISGFWFPSVTLALKALNIQKSTYLRWRKQGTEGELVRIKGNSISDIPQYVSGFWWPNLYIASSILGVVVRSLRYRIKRGFIEAEDRKCKAAIKNLKDYKKVNPLPKHSLKVKINGIIYNSILEASRETQISVSKIRTRLNNFSEGFEYA